MNVFLTKAGHRTSFLSALTITCFMTFSAPTRAQNLPIYTSPIDITGGRLSITAFAPDRNSGGMVPLPIPAAAFGPRMTALTSAPINVLMDGRWNGTPAQAAAGTSPRRQACDGPSGVKVQVARQASANGSTAYDINCNFGTTGQVFVKQVGSTLYLSYQVLNNTANFRTTSHLTCHPGNGSLLCPNDPSFEVRFAVEVLTVIWTPSLCTIRAEAPDVYLHGVQIESHNFASDLALFYDAAFGGNRFLAGELAMQARETRAPLTVDDAFNELRSSTACTGNSAESGALRTFSQFEAIVKMPQGIELRATHPPIPAPRIQNVSLPYGIDTCEQGYVWREAYPGDHVCVIPQTRTQAARDNALADSRRAPNGGPFGPNTCQQGYVWREARIGDLVCVPPQTRSQTAEDNTAAASHRVLQPSSIPSFTRPSITAPPVVAAGANFRVLGQFFPPTLDPTTIQIFMERDGNSACLGGATELKTLRTGAAAVSVLLPATKGSMSSCNYRHDVKGLLTSMQYHFLARDCDAVTCSAWSNVFETMTGSQSINSAQLILDNGVNLGNVATRDNGTFEAAVTMPISTSTGAHKLAATSGLASDSIDIQVIGSQAAARIMVTGAYFGDQGCPMRPAPNAITATQSFTLFGSGFQPGSVNIRLDSADGSSLGSATAQADGTFCAYFSGPSSSSTGAHNLVAVQNGSLRATLAVSVGINNPIH